MPREGESLIEYFSRRIAEIECIRPEEVTPRYIRERREEEMALMYGETRILEEEQGRWSGII